MLCGWNGKERHTSTGGTRIVGDKPEQLIHFSFWKIKARSETKTSTTRKEIKQYNCDGSWIIPAKTNAQEDNRSATGAITGMAPGK